MAVTHSVAGDWFCCKSIVSNSIFKGLVDHQGLIRAKHECLPHCCWHMSLRFVLEVTVEKKLSAEPAMKAKKIRAA